VTHPDPAVARVECVLPALPDVVFREWLDADALAEWMCPLPDRLRAVEIDARPGGAFRFDIIEGDVSFTVTGRYMTIDPPHHLSFTWSCSTWPVPALETIVTVSLAGHGASDTLMTIEHTLLPPDLVAQHQLGWAQIGEQLRDVVATRQRGIKGP
jgi:uncharacterized protein YndB with AHSA1/START domain